MLRIIRVDRLRIEGFVDAAQVPPGGVKVGQRVRLHDLRIRLDGERSVPVDLSVAPQPIEGEVVFVGQEIVNHSYKVWAEVDNVWVTPDPSRPNDGYWLLMSGMRVDMTIHLASVARSPEVLPVIGSK